jgi:DNA-binding response OmpR family regulator
MAEKNVLIIDDDTLLCGALSRRLSFLGVNAVSAKTGNEGLNKARQKTFDIIFIDINLPDINGIDLLEKIQKLSLFTKLVIITSETNEEYRRTAINKGAIDYIEKPFGFFEIKKHVNSILSNCIEKREYQRFSCNIPCNISILDEPDADEEQLPNNEYLNGTVIDISKNGIGLSFKKDTTDIINITKGKFVRLLTDIRDHSFFEFLSSNIIAEIVWVNEQGDEVFAGLKYLNTI